jgi:hypothetical protein
LDGVLLRANHAAHIGGGIDNNGATFNLGVTTPVTIGGPEDPDANEAGEGGGLFNESGSFLMTGGSIQGNKADFGLARGGGVGANGGNLIFTGINFVNNLADNSTGGGIFADSTAMVTVNLSRFSGNIAASGSAIFNNGSNTVNAENDWWACNDFPNVGAVGCETTFGAVDSNPRLVFRLTPSSATINTGQTQALSGDITQNSDGNTINASVFNGIDVAFAPGSFGSVFPGSHPFNSGLASTTFLAPSSVNPTPATTHPTAGLDTAVVHSTITINQITGSRIATSTVMNPVSPEPSKFGQVVTLSAIVTKSSGAADPTGTVTFMGDGTVLGFGTVTTSGGVSSASVTKSDFTATDHTITASYGGDANFEPSTSSSGVNHTVNRADTQTDVSQVSPPNNAATTYGQQVTFQATVSAVAPGAGTPGGTVEFEQNGNPINEVIHYSLLGSNLIAQINLSRLPAGDDQITARFIDLDGNFNSSNFSAPFIHHVDAGDTTTTVESSKNPSQFGETVTFTATVTPKSGPITPTGSVTFAINGNPFFNGVVNLDSNGRATITIPNADNPNPIPPGNVEIDADYNGDLGYIPGVRGKLPGGQTVKMNAGQVLISELRFNGPSPNFEQNEFVELYNNTDFGIRVESSDGSGGWGVFGADGVRRFFLTDGTFLPARGHYLGVNSNGYGLGGYRAGTTNSGAPLLATGDAFFALDLTGGAALFTTIDPVNISMDNRLDAVGYDMVSGSPIDSLYREGPGIPSNAGGGELVNTTDYAFFRDEGSGTPKDSDNNVEDFLGADTNFGPTNLGTRLGAPGPQNLSSPITHNELDVSLLDTTVPRFASPNRFRDVGDPRGLQGVLILRRRITNNTSRTIFQLRLRAVQITTFPTPDSHTADLRVLDESGLGGPVQVTVHDPSRCGGAASCDLPVQPLTLEQPPTQPNGGGWNSSLGVSTVNLNQPLLPGNSVDVEVALAVEQTGKFNFLANLEALLE